VEYAPASKQAPLLSGSAPIYYLNMQQGCWPHVWSHQVRLTCYVGRRTLGPLSPDTNTVREETDHFWGPYAVFGQSAVRLRAQQAARYGSIRHQATDVKRSLDFISLFDLPRGDEDRRSVGFTRQNDRWGSRDSKQRVTVRFVIKRRTSSAR
jgi:hypothetical protein